MSTGVPLRVLVLDAWDEIELEVPPDLTLQDLKREALTRAGVTAPPEQYLLKYRGAEVRENGATIAQAGIVPNAALIVLSRRRRPVR